MAATGTGTTLTGTLTIDMSGFLSVLQGGLDKAGQAVQKWATGSGRVKVDVDTKPAEEKASRLKDTFQNALSFAGGQLIANGIQGLISGVAGFAEKSFNSLNRIERINAQTASAIESTGGVAGITAEHIINLTGEMENLTATEAESVQQGANLLLTFTNIRNSADGTNPVFDRTVGLMNDMARALDKTGKAEIDTSAQAIQLGKALNDPIKGITALSKVGVSFSEEQKQTIKSLQESGDIAAAQTVILDELQKEFGGSAAAYAATTQGQIELAKHALGTLGETAVSALAPLAGTLSKSLADGLNTLATGIAKVNEILGPSIQKIGALLNSVLGPVFDTLNALLEPLAALLGPLLDLVTAILTPIMSVLTTLGQTLGQIIGALAQTLGAVIAPLAQVISAIFDPLADVINSVIGPLGKIIADAILPLADQFTALGAVIQPLIERVFGVLASILKAVLLPALQLAGNLFKAFSSILVTVLGVVVNVIDAALVPLGDVFTVIVSVLNTVVNALQPIIKIFSDALKPILAIITPILQQFGNIFATLLVSALRIVTPLLQLVAGVINALLPILVGSNEQWGALTGLIQLLIPVLEGLLKVLDFVVGGIGKMLTKLTDFLHLTNTIEDKAKDIAKKRLDTLTAAAQEVVKIGENAIKLNLGGDLKSIAEVDAALKKLTDRWEEQKAIKREGLTPEEEQALESAYDILIAKANEAAEARKNALAPPSGGAAGGEAPPPPEKAEKQTVLKLTKEIEDIRKDARSREAEAAIAAIEDQEKKERDALNKKYDDQITTATEKQQALLDKLNENAKKEKPDPIEIGGVIVSQAEAERQLAAALTEQTKAIEKQRLQAQKEQEEKFQADRLKRQEEATKKEIETLRKQQELITGETADALQKRFDLERQARARERTLITDATELKVFDAETIRKNAEAETAIDLAVRRAAIAKETDLRKQQYLTELLDLDTKLEAELAANEGNEAKITELKRQAAKDRAAIEASYLNDTNLFYRTANVVKGALEKAFTVTVTAEDQKRNKERQAAAEKELQDLREKQAAGLVSLKEYNARAAALQDDLNAASQKKIVNFAAFTEEVGKRFTSALSEIAKSLGSSFDDTLQKFSEGNAKLSDLLVSTAGALTASIADAASNNEDILEATLRTAGKLAFDFLQKMVPVWMASAFGVTVADTGLLGTPLAIAGFITTTALLEGLVAAARGILNLHSGIDTVPGVYKGRDTVPAMLAPGEAVIQRDMAIKYGPFVRAIRRDDYNALRELVREPRGFRYSIGPDGLHDRLVANEARTTAALANVATLQDSISGKLEQTNAELAFVKFHLGRIAKTNESMDNRDGKRDRTPTPARKT